MKETQLSVVEMIDPLGVKSCSSLHCAVPFMMVGVGPYDIRKGMQ